MTKSRSETTTTQDFLAPVWTSEMVASHLACAADTLSRLPAPSVPGHYNSWPSILRTVWELGHFADGPTSPASPTPRAISQMEETLLWLRWLDPGIGKMVWRRANGCPWKAIADEFGMDRTTAWRQWKIAVATIAAHLNAQVMQQDCNTEGCNRIAPI